MKTTFRWLFPPLTAVLLVINPVAAATFATLHTFEPSQTDTYGNLTNSDGKIPTGLVLSGDTLYGTAFAGGVKARGTFTAL